MKLRVLLAAILCLCLSGLVYAQADDSSQEAGSSQEVSYQSLLNEHKAHIQQERQDNKAWWQNYQSQWKDTVSSCKSEGLSAGECNAKYLKDLRQEAVDHVKSESAQRKNYRQDMKDAYKDNYLRRLQNRQQNAQQFIENHPNINPPGPREWPGAGPAFRRGRDNNLPGPRGGRGTN